MMMDKMNTDVIHTHSCYSKKINYKGKYVFELAFKARKNARILKTNRSANRYKIGQLLMYAVNM